MWQLYCGMVMVHCGNTVVSLPESYIQKQQKFFISGEQGIYPVMDYMELWNVNLTKALSIPKHPLQVQHAE